MNDRSTRQTELEQELSRINSALGEGVVRVQSGARSTQFDLAEKRRRRDEIRLEIAALAAPRPRVRHVRTYSTKGL